MSVGCTSQRCRNAENKCEKAAFNRCRVTILPRVNTELVDASWRLSQNVNGVAGGVHVVEEVDRQGREGKHQHPQDSQHICDHYELDEQSKHKGASSASEKR